MAIEQLELAFRVAVGLFVVVAPTLLFLGLWRGLMYLRDDELIERVCGREGRASPSSPRSLFTGGLSSAADRESPVVCEACGAPNGSGVEFCRECLSSLPER